MWATQGSKARICGDWLALATWCLIGCTKAADPSTRCSELTWGARVAAEYPNIDDRAAARALARIQEAKAECQKARQVVETEKVALAKLQELDASQAKLLAEHRGLMLATPPESAEQRPQQPPDTPSPGVGNSMADVLKEQPSLPLTLPAQWSDRIHGHLRGDLKASCPAIAAGFGGDEFERADKQASAASACHEENRKALDFADSCALRSTFKVWIKDYDFAKRQFPIWTMNQEPYRLVHSGSVGKVLIEGRWLLDWPGAYPYGAGEIERKWLPSKLQLSGASPCSGALLDVLPTLATLRLDLEMSLDDAKAFRSNLRDLHSSILDAVDAIEVVFALDATVADELLPCDQVSPKVPHGRVLAWRLVVAGRGISKPAIDWQSLSHWEQASKCQEAFDFFGVKQATEAEDDTCVCDVVGQWQRVENAVPFGGFMYQCGDINEYEVEDKLRYIREHWESNRAEAEKVLETIASRPGCTSDGTAKAQMLREAARVRAAIDVWTRLLKAENPSLAQVNQANRVACPVNVSIRKRLDSSCTGTSCKFGCK